MRVTSDMTPIVTTTKLCPQSHCSSTLNLKTMQQTAPSDRGRKMADHRVEHHERPLAPEAFASFEFGRTRQPTTEPKVAGSSPAGCTFFNARHAATGEKLRTPARFPR